MPFATITIKHENTLTIPCLTRNPGDRVAGFRLSPEWYFRKVLVSIIGWKDRTGQGKYVV
jgi:hypothetical protein